jgi:hypothetical protein
MAPKTYDCYVRLGYALLDHRLVPVARAFKHDDQENLPGGWRDLVNDNTICVWLVERSSITHAQALVLAHLAGHAPVGIKLLYEVGSFDVDKAL